MFVDNVFLYFFLIYQHTCYRYVQNEGWFNNRKNRKISLGHVISNHVKLLGVGTKPDIARFVKSIV